MRSGEEVFFSSERASEGSWGGTSDRFHEKTRR